MLLRETVIHRILRRAFVLHAGFDDGKIDAPQATIVFLHGLGRTSSMWAEIAERLLKNNPNIRVVAVDLLGFGDSARPSWQTYNAAMQAKSLRQTLRKLGIRQPVIVVGHSLGALVAAEYAWNYPKSVRNLLLVSAPIYRDEPRHIDRKLRRPILGEPFYKGVLKNLRLRQDLTKRLNTYGRRFKIFADDFVVDDKNILAVSRSIEMAIENQSTYDHILHMTLPTLLIYGRLDPFLIKKYYRQLSSRNPNVSVASVVAGHEISSNKRFSTKIIREITQIVALNEPAVRSLEQKP